MDLKSNFPFWLVKNGLMAAYPALEHDEVCDVLVLGAGITGAIFAERLSREGFDVVVLDRRDVGQGSTSASTALLMYEIDTHLVELTKLVGRAHADRAYQLSAASIDTLEQLALHSPVDCGFRRKRSVYAASTEAEVPDLRAELEARLACGIRAAWAGPRELSEQYAINYPGAIVSEAAASCDPYRLAHGLLQQAQERGVRVFDRTDVTKFTPQPAGDACRVTAQTDRGPSVKAKHVVFASGYESQQYLSERVVKFKSTYALVTQPLPSVAPWPEDCLFWESSRPYLYLRATDDRRLLAGGEDDDFHSPTKRDAQLGAKADKILKRLQTMFPTLALETEFAWAGTFGETKDGLAYIGRPPELSWGYFALGFGGNGITFSAIAADIIADELSGRPNADAAIFRFGR
ncbi:MAG: hypothetical protein C0483_03140 [Pirellula sp.]|nr:hypothetical protein [Pirellula sp.]